MDEKSNAQITITMLISIIAMFLVADFFNKDRVYSELEMRLLTGRPDFTKEKFLQGQFSSEYENYITDQFPGRDKLVGIKTRTDILLGKREIGGAYIGKDGYLIEQHLPEEYPAELEDQKIELLLKLVDEWDADVMLVPTADNILVDKMPSNAAYYDEEKFLNKVKESVGSQNYIDVYSVLKEHCNEDIYYRTDHHWNALGTYYGYQAWKNATQSFKFPYDPSNMTTVSQNFRGSLYSKVPVVRTRDEIKIFPATTFRKVSVTYDFDKTTGSLYEESYLEGKNQYAYFLDDNHAFVEINTNYRNGKKLFIIKDSFANSFIPLLQPHYETIYAVDLRYYNGKLEPLMKNCSGDDNMDVLVLYNCTQFLEDFKYY